MELPGAEIHTTLQPDAPLLLWESGCEMPRWRWPTGHVGPGEFAELSWDARAQ